MENEFTKARIISKIKGIRVKYRRAVDSGRRSGGGRVVATFYNACESIWGGCPAVETINGGIKSSLPATDDPQNIKEADGDKDDHLWAWMKMTKQISSHQLNYRIQTRDEALLTT